LALVAPTTKRRMHYTGGILLVVVASQLLGQIEWTTARGAPKQASLIQGNIPQNQKWLPEFRQPSIDLYTGLTRQHWDSDIVIWPETALPAYFHQAKSFLNQLADEAIKNETDLFIGMPVIDEQATQERRYYNSFVLIKQPFAFYHKQHLVPFGEFIPFKSMLGSLFSILNIPMADFSRGSRDQLTLPITGGLQAGISICYEDAFGDEMIDAMPQANLLINVSNDAWFGDSLAPHLHLQMAQMRSLEGGRPMLRATNNGVSAIFDHKGNIKSVSPQFQQTVLTGSIQPRQGSTPYVLVGNSVIVISSFLFCLIPYWRSKRGDNT
jgi:apolipoprotein N-acyltransferase